MGCGQSGRSGLGFPETERCVGVVPWVGRGGLWEHLESVTGFDSGKQPCAWKEGSAVPSDHQPHPVSFSASEQDLPRKVLSGLKIGVYVTNDREQIIAVNPRGEKLLGRSESAMIGRNAHDLLHRAEGGALLPRSQCPLMKAFLQGQSVYGGNKWFPRGDGALLPVIWLTAPYRINRDTTGALVLFHPRDPRGDPSSEEVPVDQVTTLTDLADSLSLIAEVTSVLTSTLQVREALWLLARQVTPRLADWVVIDLLNEIGELERALVVHHENGRHIRREEMQGPLPPVSETSLMPLSRVLRGASTTRVSLRDYQRPPDTGLAMAQRTLFERTRIHAAITAPLRGPRGAILGALTLGRADQLHDFTSTELALVDDLARQAGLAIDNARLYERQQRVTETMQRYLLSPLPETVLVKMAVRYHPAPDASHVGGDWYDAFVFKTAPLLWLSGMWRATTCRPRLTWRRSATCCGRWRGTVTSRPAVSSAGWTTRWGTSVKSPWPPWFLRGLKKTVLKGGGFCGGRTLATCRRCWCCGTGRPVSSTSTTTCCWVLRRIFRAPTPLLNCRWRVRSCSIPTGLSNPPATVWTRVWRSCVSMLPSSSTTSSTTFVTCSLSASALRTTMTMSL